MFGAASTIIIREDMSFYDLKSNLKVLDAL